MDSFAAFLLKADDSRVISTNLQGTDVFISMFRYNPEYDVREIIETELTKFCSSMGEYKEYPLIIKAGLCFFEFGQPIARAIEIAKELKYGMDFDRCICLSRKMNPSEAVF